MPSVLVIDDEDQIRRLIREALEQAGYVVEEARGGKEGLERYRTNPADVVLMDILMPDQDGLESMLTLRREFPAFRVIAMSGGGMIGVLNFLDVAKMMGACRTLQKPFEMKALLDAVAAASAEATAWPSARSLAQD
jgi:CheY-like chemotaxis protein